MSWLFNPTAEPRPSDDDTPKVADPTIPGRMVSTKSANKPFLAHKEYRDRQKALHNAWLERKEERDAKIARGEEVGPEEKDPTAEEEVGLLGLLKFIVYLLIFAAFAGKFFTGSWTWEYEGKWTQLKTFWPTDQRLFSENLLAQFDGTNPEKPIYLAIDHDVYDVSSNPATYGPGGSYHLMAGIDAARSFATGCFKDHRTHDLRGLSEKELKSVEHWKKFFSEHKSYRKVGKVVHPPIDPFSPVPKHCNPKKQAEAEKSDGRRKNKVTDDAERLPREQPTGSKHEEL